MKISTRRHRSKRRSLAKKNNIREGPLETSGKEGSEALGETEFGETTSVISHKTELSLRTIPSKRSSERASDSEEEKEKGGKGETSEEEEEGKKTGTKKGEEEISEAEGGSEKEEKRKRQRGKNRT